MYINWGNCLWEEDSKYHWKMYAIRILKILFPMHQWQGHHTFVFWASQWYTHSQYSYPKCSRCEYKPLHCTSFREQKLLQQQQSTLGLHIEFSSAYTHCKLLLLQLPYSCTNTKSPIFRNSLRACQRTGQSCPHTRQNLGSWFNLLIIHCIAYAPNYIRSHFFTMQFALFTTMDYNPSDEAQYSQITTVWPQAFEEMASQPAKLRWQTHCTKIRK